MIEICGLKKSFNNTPVLEEINLTINTGKIYGLVGRSGAGKSTLLRCINGLETYDEGSLKVDGVEVKDLSPKEAKLFKKNIGMIFQQFSLLNRLNIYDNIALPMKCWKYDNNYIDKKVKELVELVGIPDKLYSKPKELSGGQKQRVAIARALSMNPKILLSDEATSALDPKTADSIIQLLNEINENLNITVVMVTHQMSVLRKSCEEISILENGHICVSGEVEKIFQDKPQALKNLMGDNELLLPQTGVNLRIIIPKDSYKSQIITQMIQELGENYAIIGGETEVFRSGVLGSIIINVTFMQLEKITEYLDGYGVIWNIISTNKAKILGGDVNA